MKFFGCTNMSLNLHVIKIAQETHITCGDWPTDDVALAHWIDDTYDADGRLRLNDPRI